jgi:hypothetical protein
MRICLAAVLLRRPTAQHARAGAQGVEPGKFLLARVVGVFRLFLRVQVVEIAEELVKSMRGRQELVEVAEMVLPKLTGGVTQRFQ